MTEITFTDAKPVDGYGPGFFRIGGEVVSGSVALLPTGLANWDGFEDAKVFATASNDIDVLIVGTGPEILHIPAEFREAIESAGIGVETMASPSACRTYNVLLAEGRRVGLAVLPV